MTDEFIIDAGPLGGSISGAGRYTFKLIEKLLKIELNIPFRIIVPSDIEDDWNISEWTNNKNVTFEIANITGAGIFRHAYYARHRPTCRIHHSLSSYVPLFSNNDRTIVTIHDLKHFKLTETLESLGWIKRTYIKRMITRSVRVADHIITVSEHTKSDIIDEFNIPSSSVSVVPLGPGAVYTNISGAPPVDPPYIFFVGALRRHKNIDTLIEAFQIYKDNNDTNVDLVIAGGIRSGYQSKLNQVIAEEHKQSIHFLGYVSDNTVARLYKHAIVFVYPSLYEGFGLPPLEAMGYGIPVIVSNHSSIPEVVGDAGEYVDPTEPDELAKTLEKVLMDEDLQERLIQQGYDRYKQFSWKRTATETLDIYRDLYYDTTNE